MGGSTTNAEEAAACLKKGPPKASAEKKQCGTLAAKKPMKRQKHGVTKWTDVMPADRSLSISLSKRGNSVLQLRPQIRNVNGEVFFRICQSNYAMGNVYC